MLRLRLTANAWRALSEGKASGASAHLIPGFLSHDSHKSRPIRKSDSSTAILCRKRFTHFPFAHTII
jgi:hypothetical protein